MSAAPSSLTDPAIGRLLTAARTLGGDRARLLLVLAAVPDPRARRRVRHKLAVIMGRRPHGVLGGLCPLARQFGPRTRVGKKRRGDTWLRGSLGQATVGAARNATFPGERYSRIARRRGKAKAQVAVARSILVMRFVSRTSSWLTRSQTNDPVERVHPVRTCGNSRKARRLGAGIVHGFVHETRSDGLRWRRP
jgi:hypothetical protein